MYKVIIAEFAFETNRLSNFLYTAWMAPKRTAGSENGSTWDKRFNKFGQGLAMVRWIQKQKLPWISIAFWLMVVSAIGLRSWNLDRLQAEAFGDITTAWLYVEDVLSGRWPFYIPLSTGPLFHYVFAGVALLSGLSYFGLKVASVVVSLAALLFTYLFAKRLLGATFAILATFIAGVSFWLLIHSRLGNVPIGVPLLSMAMVWLLLRYKQESQNRDLYLAAAVSILGLYTYAAAYILPAAMIATLLTLRLTGYRIHISKWLRMVALFLVLSIPFVWIISQNAGAFGSSGYLGAKFALNGETLDQLARNTLAAFSAYNIRGDEISRVNPMGHPHLDQISGVLFLLGVWFWLQRPRRREGLIILVPFILLHLPSMLVITNNQEVPSSTRTVGAAPLAYILVASGLWQVAAWLRPRVGKIISTAVGLALVVAIATLNLKEYFVNYIHNLPYENTPIARMITDYMRSLPGETQVYLVGCCWEESMPEPLSIEYEFENPQNFHYIQPQDLSCRGLDVVLTGPAVVIWDYRNELPADQLDACAAHFPAQLYTSPTGLPVFRAATVQGLRTFAPGESLTTQWLIIEGQLVLVRYSVLDTGRIEDVFDGNLDSLMRGLEANPFVLEFEVDEPHRMNGVELTLAAAQDFAVSTTITYRDNSTAVVNNNYSGLPSDPTVEIQFPPSEVPVALVHIEIKDLRAQPGDGFHIHVREIELKFAE